MFKPLTIAVDLDNTVIFHGMKALVPGAKEVLKKWHEAGHRLILWTCRDHESAKKFAAWLLAEHNIAFHDLNHRNDQPTDSPKVLADLYVDDRAVGCPTKRDVRYEDGLAVSSRSIVDWIAIDNIVAEKAWVELP